MITSIRYSAYCALLCLVLLSTARAQGTAFTYQGRLNNSGAPASGNYDVAFTLYATNVTGNAVAGPVTNSAVTVSNGLFTTAVDFGPGVFTGSNYWLELAVSTNGANAFSSLAPRQQLTPVPYAIFANSASNLLGTLPTSQLSGAIPATQLSGTIPSADISGTYGNAVDFDNGANTFDGTFYGQFLGNSFIGGTFTGQFIGDGSGLININPAHIAGQVAYLNSNQVFTAQNVFMQPVGLGTPNPSPIFQIDALAGQSEFRLTTTNSNTGAVLELKNTVTNTGYFDYLGAINFNNHANSYPGQIGYFVSPGTGTPDYLAIRIGGLDQSFELVGDPTGQGADNLINGYYNYAYTYNSGGDFIGGGGSATQPNVVLTSSSDDFIGTGLGNQIGPNANLSVVVGGNLNTNATAYGFIGGGTQNLLQFNNWGAFIGGGYQNIIQSGSGYSTIPSGYQNMVQTNASACVIGGGAYNLIQTNSAESAIGGGSGNIIQPIADHATIAGGFNNLIQTNAWDSVIAGGYGNVISPFAEYAFIGGGNINSNSAIYSVIGGGYYNTILAGNSASVIAGGAVNMIQTNSLDSAIGGGSGNVIQPLSDHSTIAGGYNNLIQSDAWDSAILGGLANQIQIYAIYSAVGGGYDNTIAGNSNYWASDTVVGDFIGGGAVNHIQADSAYATIGGGVLNLISTNSNWAAIAGGADNAIGSDSASATIAGGWYNTVSATNATVGGGASNQVAGIGGTVPGGLGNLAGGINSFAAGTFAHATNDGAFVLTDDGPTNFYSTASNQLSARFTGGVRFVTAGAGMTLDGQPIMSSATVLNSGQLSGAYANTVSFNNSSDSFTGNGTGLTNVNAALLNGLSSSAFAPASGSPNYIQNQTGTPQAASFNITGNAIVGGNEVVAGNVTVTNGLTASTLFVTNAQVTGYLRLGSETNTASGPNYPAGSPGLVIRRIASTTSGSGVLVARTDQLQLQRDGTVSGLQMTYATTGNFQTINAFGITTNGTMVVYRNTVRSAGSGTLAMFTDSQKVVHYDISFGNPYNDGHTCHVVLDRYDDGLTSDNYLVGSVTTTYNQ